VDALSKVAVYGDVFVRCGNLADLPDLPKNRLEYLPTYLALDDRHVMCG
jgi:hypothetical protein